MVKTMLLKITTADGECKTISLAGKNSVMIGRSESADLYLADKKISRRHAEISINGDGIFLDDLSSRTGTRVNGESISGRTRLSVNDSIQIGETTLVLENPSPANLPPERKESRSHKLPLYSAQTNLVDLYSETMIQLAKRVQNRVLEILNIGNFSSREMTNSEMRPKVESAVDQILREIRHEIPFTVKLDQFQQILLDDLIGLGPLSPLLRDTTISEIMINGPDNIFVESRGLLYRTVARFNSESHLQAIIQRIVEPLGRHIDAASPMVDARLEDGSRVNAVIPPLALDGSLVTIRKFPSKKLTDEDLIKFGSLTRPMALFLREAVRARRNILVSGGTGSGKTTLLNILSSFLPYTERIVTIEDAAELQLRQDHVVRLESRPANIEGKGEVSIRDLVRNLPLRAIREQIASAIAIIVQINREKDGTRKVTNISEITRMEGDIITMQDLFYYHQDGWGADGKMTGRHVPSGNLPSFMEDIRRAGLKLDTGIFSRGMLKGEER